MAQRNSIATKAINDGVFTATFSNGNVVELRLSDLNEAVIQRALEHGLLQTLGDSYANCKGDVVAAEAQLIQRVETLKSGVWATKTQGALAIDILMHATEQDRETVTKKWHALKPDEQDKIKASPLYKKAAMELKVKKLNAAAKGSSIDF